MADPQEQGVDPVERLLFVQCPHGHAFVSLDPVKFCPGCGTSTLGVAVTEYCDRFRAALRDAGLLSPGGVDEGGREAKCERLLIGQGTDTWDPLCQLPRGHSGRCVPGAKPDSQEEEGRG